jgi:hypothetical protein
MQECVGFQELDVGVGPNPRSERAMVIEAFGSEHRPVPQTEVTNIRNFIGLSCGGSISISFAIASDSVELSSRFQARSKSTRTHQMAQR